MFRGSLCARDDVCRVYGFWFLRVLVVVEIEKHAAADQRKPLILEYVCLPLSDVDVDIKRPGK